MTYYRRMLHEMLANLHTTSYTGNNIEDLYTHAVIWVKNLLLPRAQKEDRPGLHMSDDEKPSVTLRLPSTLSAYSGGKSQIVLHGKTVEEMLEELGREYPQVWAYLCTEEGNVREHVKMFVNNEMISGPDSMKTGLKAGQEIIVLPAFFGV
jgi:sulfur-carrier protein